MDKDIIIHIQTPEEGKFIVAFLKEFKLYSGKLNTFYDDTDSCIRYTAKLNSIKRGNKDFYQKNYKDIKIISVAEFVSSVSNKVLKFDYIKDVKKILKVNRLGLLISDEQYEVLVKHGLNKQYCYG